jgi:glutathione S-transferase
MVYTTPFILRFFFELDSPSLNVYDIVTLKYIDIPKGELKSDMFLSVNALGTLPTYVDEEGDTYIESGAMLLTLAEKWKHEVDLIPYDEKEYFQWIVFSVSTRIVKPYLFSS